MPATNRYIPRVAVIFDFDETLATDSVDAICAAWGIGREEWEERYFKPLGHNWDKIIKRSQALLDCGRDRGEPLSADLFEKAARKVELYPGVTELKQRLTACAREILEELEVELVVLSSGYVEIIRRTAVRDSFDHVWASSFHGERSGGEVRIKRIISHPEKARYVEAFAKGLDLDSANEPRVDPPGSNPHDMHVPFDQIIYLGDGLSDLATFKFVTGHGGLAIAVNKGEGFEYAKEQTADQRVDHLAPPDYSPGAELMEALYHAVRSAASRTALRKLGCGE
ncbi:haloacid dehalogenase-like hydrolase [Altericroceibacterium xinjiangense]|uniref:haloacid dehalogenase-like hydrolase n=1 Tax=Altericroceibacterium xinjiangense TaxID=762261 RepID=UPI0013DFD933|nr:haloacid dehalogenase-like hydrolase [Altericroceibacterium xinjiangense]